MVDDDDAVVSSLQVLLESIGYQVRGYTSARVFLREFDIDLDVGGCIILDERMPEMSGRVLQEELTRRGCMMPIILYTGYADVEYAVELMRNGAFTVLQKPSNDRALVDAVAEALWQDARARENRQRRRRFEDARRSLTARQGEVLDLVVRGMPSRGIAKQLGLSERTIELHRARILQVMGVKSTAALVYLVALNSDDARR